MKALLPAALGAVMLAMVPASAASLCNCCGSDTAASCAKVCEPVKPAPGQCVATVDFAGTAIIGKDQNPLYDMPLKNLWLGTPSRDDLEAFRRLLENARRGPEKDRRAALKAYAKGKIDRTAADAAAKRYEDAIVNYYLGVHAYRSANRG